MQRILYTILFNLILLSCLQSQDIHKIKEFSDDQYEKGNYLIALKEYHRVLFFDSEFLYNDAYAKIASIYYRMDDFEKALEYYNFAWRTEIDDSIKIELVFGKALCNFKQYNYLLALNDLFDLPASTSIYHDEKKNLYLGICYFGLEEYNNSLFHLAALVDSIGIIHMNKLFVDFEKYRKRYNPEKAELMSMLLPGLGQIYVGDIKSGINSILLLSGITTYAIITTINYGFIDGALIVSSWFYRYYSGGSTKAKNIARTRITQEKSFVYDQILKIVNDNPNLSTL